MTEGPSTTQLYAANEEIHSASLSFALLFQLRILSISILVISLASCKHHSQHWKIDPAWEKLVEQERSQPNSIIQVDNSVVAYMKKNNVPGLSIAIAKDEKLIYVKAYGYADITTREKVTTKSLFRIADISNVITSIAIMKLIQEKKLSPDSKVFGKDGMLANDYEPLPVGSNTNNITIDQLLHHTCGGWTNGSISFLYNDLITNPTQLIAWTIKNQPLKNSPGTVYVYSNFGYCVLGRVIEKVTGQHYADYVNSKILLPLGITDMEIGANVRAERKPNEVFYYEEGDEPYFVNISRLDAAIGWIASATDLLKLTASVDGFKSQKDILDSSIIKKMFTPSIVNPGYACGWQLRASGDVVNWFHFGELIGSASMLAHIHTGFSWAILTNTGYQDEQSNPDFDRVVWNAINDSTIRWPGKDLF